jgi:hypothetical protein
MCYCYYSSVAFFGRENKHNDIIGRQNRKYGCQVHENGVERVAAVAAAAAARAPSGENSSPGNNSFSLRTTHPPPPTDSPRAQAKPQQTSVRESYYYYYYYYCRHRRYYFHRAFIFRISTRARTRGSRGLEIRTAVAA